MHGLSGRPSNPNVAALASALLERLPQFADEATERICQQVEAYRQEQTRLQSRDLRTQQALLDALATLPGDRLRNISAFIAMFPDDSIEVAGTALRYQEAGSGPPVLFLHGAYDTICETMTSRQ